jgi:hypothetical protein
MRSSSSDESSKVSFILPLEIQTSSNNKCCPEKRCCVFLVISVLLAIGALHCILTGNTSNSRGWDSSLQKKLVEQARSLLLKANRSIHDDIARQFLRKLAKDNLTACFSPNCLHTGN